jgi:hypothetical protein
MKGYDVMKKGVLILTAVLYGLLRGLHEGMIMSMTGDALHTGVIEGVRGHVGFGDYHLIGIAGIVLTAVLFTAVLFWRPRPMLIIGGMLLMWEATEIGYAFARTGWPVAAWEHVNFFDMVSIELLGWQVWATHAVRTAAGILLTRTGGVR